MPVLALDVNDVDIIAFLVEKGIKSLSRAQRDIVLRGVATTDDGNVSLQILHLSFICFVDFFVILLSVICHSGITLDIASPFSNDGSHILRPLAGEVHLLPRYRMNEAKGARMQHLPRT